MTSTTSSQDDREPRVGSLPEADAEGHILRTYPGLVDDQSPRRVVPQPNDDDTEGHILRTYPELVDDQSPRRVVPQPSDDDVEGHRRVPQDDLAPRRVLPSVANN